MRPFSYDRAHDLASAIRAASAQVEVQNRAPIQFLAGGTNLLDLMKIDVMRPERLVDINPLEDSLSEIVADGDGLRLGGLARMSTVAHHPDVEKNYPVLSQSLKLAASAQLRNMASLAGNVLQRTRCSYFRDVSWGACNKREPGSGCAAIGGVNRKHAVLGTSPHCIATYPGDFAQALIALDATVEITGPKGERRIPVHELHRLPGDTPHIENTLAAGEIITAFQIPRKAWAKRSLYLKVRDRESYEFAVASAAVALDLADGVVRDVRIALGGVATIPWRAVAAEEVLKGKPLTEDIARSAAEAAFEPARTHGENDFKPELGRNTLVRALLDAAKLEA
ncbi:FAD binding domain-containing protein [Microvirga subterranea]|uniref:Xanthine dehydrogenase YagS FAD-binding subunit n=1 Tax=Microvirga subterranea TaxID=186651 RepID=A0A370HTC1_9HYPH|nr:xanthine dehydrogenase family protein subunit M [Microvirga subterranea]RDI61773.1 xanthine dehydrogenase YagS FAD-binding subunit [Microvirga subterranea]